jgi:hypothetical protein
MAKYNDDTLLSVLIADEMKKTETLCHGAPEWNKKHASKTLGEMADVIASDRAYNPNWGLWLLGQFGTDFSTSIRKRLLAAIKDPMSAFNAYLTFAWLTSEEDKLLEEKFKQKLPAALKELDDGIVTRAKKV